MPGLRKMDISTDALTADGVARESRWFDDPIGPVGVTVEGAGTDARTNAALALLFPLLNGVRAFPVLPLARESVSSSPRK